MTEPSFKGMPVLVSGYVRNGRKSKQDAIQFLQISILFGLLVLPDSLLYCFNPLLGATCSFVYFLQRRLGRPVIVMPTYWFVCPAIVAKSLWCIQPVNEVQLTSICYVQICVYSRSYGEFLGESIVSFADSTPSSHSPLLSVTPVGCMDTGNFIRGRNSSVGSAWARCPQCRGFDPPLGKFSGGGDFSLGVNMGSNSIPPKTPSDESIN